MVKKKSASSQPEKRIAANEIFMMPLNEAQQRELRNLAALPDTRIDYTDAPEVYVPASEVQRGRFYRPVKQLVSLRVDAEVLAWFRGRGKKYQSYMNEVLRREMLGNPQGPEPLAPSTAASPGS